MDNSKGGRPNGFTAKEFIDAIPGTGGVMSVIAKRVGCHWHTAKKYITDHATVQQAYQNEKHAVDDKAVSNIFTDISKGSIETSKWWVRMKMGDEFAPTERIEQVTVVDWDEPDQD